MNKIKVGLISCAGLLTLTTISNAINYRLETDYLAQHRQAYTDLSVPEIERMYIRKEVIKEIADIDVKKRSNFFGLFGNFGSSLAVDDFYKEHRGDF